ncbi:tRNA (cytosine(34)-C(5))-methyltransferase, mitochondrial [Ambystoma mexicanum]|uniref:tRNA (cytosine(34)-C(5))-methyltransferase, mitochondrial n=1 Tax=Ambystoma mexicanum TaxID=8296 RepID=UPI0037E7237E
MQKNLERLGLEPGHLLCNEYEPLRWQWLRETLESFIPQDLRNSIMTSELDGRIIGQLQPEMFDKVLVDAPCSNDRSWLFASDVSQAALRLAERRALPALQIQLLSSAIKSLRPGGSLVYSTCTLSKAENCDVLAKILDTFDNILPVDLSEIVSKVSHEFCLAAGTQHGLLVTPTLDKPWGPMYVAKLKKTLTA